MKFTLQKVLNSLSILLDIVYDNSFRQCLKPYNKYPRKPNLSFSFNHVLECTGEAELPLNSVLLIDLFLQFSPNMDIQPLKGGHFNNLKNKPGLYMIVVTDTNDVITVKRYLQKVTYWPEPLPRDKTFYDFKHHSFVLW